MGHPFAGLLIEPLDYAVEAFEGVVLAEVLFDEDAEEMLAGLGPIEEGILELAAQVVGQALAEGPGRDIFVGAGLKVGGADVPVGSGLAGLGGALGAEVLGLDPSFPLKFMIYFLIVVAVGGTSSITGPLLAALLLGIADVAGKYYIPKMGGFIVYSLMILILVWRPQGLFVRKGGR